MNSRISILGFAAGAALLAGVVAAAVVIADYSSQKSGYVRDLKNLKKLNEVADEFKKLDRQLAPALRLNRGKVADVESLVRNVFPAQQVQSVERSEQLSDSGLRSISYEIRLHGVDLATLYSFVSTMESLRPPLRLRRLEAKALPAKPATADAVVTLAAVAVKEAGALPH